MKFETKDIKIGTRRDGDAEVTIMVHRESGIQISLPAGEAKLRILNDGILRMRALVEAFTLPQASRAKMSIDTPSSSEMSEPPAPLAPPPSPSFKP